MLQAIVNWSLHNRPVVLVLSFLLIVAGAYASLRSDLDAFPEFAPPQVTVQTEAVGLSADEVEQLVTLPIEQAILGLPMLEAIRSRSIQGLSSITVVFKDHADPYLARQLVAQKLAEAQSLLPDSSEIPKLGPMTKTTGRLLVVGFVSERLNEIELRDRVQWDVRPRLLALPGVAMTTIFGGQIRQYQVQVDPDLLVERQLGINDIVDATRQSTSVRGLGFQENSQQRIVLRVQGQIETEKQLAETVINRANASPLRLADIGLVCQAGEPRFGASTINGNPAVSMLIYKQFGADTLTVTRAIENELNKIQTELQSQGIEIKRGLFRQADFIEKAVGNVVHSLWLGAILVAIVLSVLLFNIRVAMISLTAIPLSLLSAISILWVFDVSLNTLTLGGLAIAVGEVVDDAIIDVENIYRRFRTAKAQLGTFDAIKVALTASLEVRSSVVYATWIVVVVFAPVLLMGGVQGRLFAPLGYAYVLATLSSLVVALTLTPVLSVLFLQKQLPTHEPPLLNVMQRIYERFLRGVIRHRILAIITSLVILSCVIYQSTKFGGEFLPELRESHLIVHMQSLAGTSLEQNVRTGQQLTKELLEDANVSNVCHLAGRAEQGEDTWGIEYGEIEVPLKDGADVDAMRQQLLAELPNKFPGNNFLAFTFLAECIHDSLSGSVAPILVKVKGPDARASDELVERISQIVRETRGSHGVFVESQDGQPECVVRIRHADAARFGLRPAEIVEAVHAAYQGAIVGQVYDRNRVSSICIVLSPRIRQRPDLVEQLWLTVPTERRIAPTTKPNPLRDSSTIDEGRVQLRQVADVFMSSGRFLVTHENGIRTRSITCDTINRDVESFANELEKRLHQIPLPAGMHIEITGEHIAKKSTQSDLFLTGSAAAVGVVLLLWMAVRSYLATMLVLINVPFSLIGGLLSVYFMGGIIDVGALVGFVTLFGISMRNSIMMVTHLQQLSVELPKLDNVSLIVLGARERLGPILMTALVTGLGLLPIAVGSDEAGREIEGPMAIVIFGGLVSSTFLNLLLLPSIASIFLSRLRRSRTGS